LNQSQEYYQVYLYNTLLAEVIHRQNFWRGANDDNRIIASVELNDLDLPQLDEAERLHS
jgi:hypothetical protein